MKKNNFEKMCDDLEMCSSCCEYNEVVCAIKYLRNYCKGDRNRLLQIKAEANGVSYLEMVSFIMSGIALFATVNSLIVTILAALNSESFKNNVIGMTLIVVILLFLVYLLIFAYRAFKKYRYTNKWHKYILVAIEELDSKKYGKSK